jgi:hypothetical protein
MNVLALTDAVWHDAILTVGALLLAYMQMRNTKAVEKGTKETAAAATAAANEVKKVKNTLEDATGEMALGDAKVALAVSDVRKSLEASNVNHKEHERISEEANKKVDQVLTLVNGAMTAKCRELAVAYRTIADASGDEDDEVKAVLAEQELRGRLAVEH